MFCPVEKNIPFNKNMALPAAHKIGGRKTQCKIFPHQLFIKKDSFPSSQLNSYSGKKTFCILSQVMSFQSLMIHTLAEVFHITQKGIVTEVRLLVHLNYLLKQTWSRPQQGFITTCYWNKKLCFHTNDD